jgi:hypothetical protein
MYAKSILKAMLGEATTGVMPVELLTTNRIMERWAVANGNGLPTERWDDTRKAKPPPLDDDSAYQIDMIVLRLPPKTKRVIVAWYYWTMPTSHVARKLGMSQRSLEKGLNVALNFVRYKIEGTNHQTLMKLLRIQI